MADKPMSSAGSGYADTMKTSKGMSVIQADRRAEAPHGYGHTNWLGERCLQWPRGGASTQEPQRTTSWVPEKRKKGEKKKKKRRWIGTEQGAPSDGPERALATDVAISGDRNGKCSRSHEANASNRTLSKRKRVLSFPGCGLARGVFDGGRYFNSRRRRVIFT